MFDARKAPIALAQILYDGVNMKPSTAQATARAESVCDKLNHRSVSFGKPKIFFCIQDASSAYLSKTSFAATIPIRSSEIRPDQNCPGNAAERDQSCCGSTAERECA
mmetsp:Transcript_112920/g.205192  ORF Transcript_112920/g.205192 Transcript_112920/m.205192 type:complete len:107 (+) Transcript_112920:728-1048(+)